MKFETIIGLEIHAQLSTASKLWCGCDNLVFGKVPNTSVCPVCMGFPGMLPVLNKESLHKAFVGAAALGCELQTFSKFDRKNYFYPDLPNGFQISQYDKPIAFRGRVDIPFEGKNLSIGITRVHLENDAGKLTHTESGTLCDYNRSGCPLIEIVTDPNMRSPEEAQVFAKELQKILRCVGASDADMEKGMMRFDASISLRPEGDPRLYPRIEIKNLNSFQALKKALTFEETKQKALWEKGTPQTTEVTVGWMDDLGETKVLRDKEQADDYRYFPEPDLPPVMVTPEYLTSIRETLPELPLARFRRYIEGYGLSENDALKLSESDHLSAFYEIVVKGSGDPKKSANFILTEVLRDPHWETSPITPQHIIEVLDLLKQGTLSASGAKTVLQAALVQDLSVSDLVRDFGLEQKSDTTQLDQWILEVLAANPESIEDFKNGKDKALQYLMGQTMKLSRGSANPGLLMERLKKRLTEL